jgi:peptidoglycan hydrolase CwlO-like protein
MQQQRHLEVIGKLVMRIDELEGEAEALASQVRETAGLVTALDQRNTELGDRNNQLQSALDDTLELLRRSEARVDEQNAQVRNHQCAPQTIVQNVTPAPVSRTKEKRSRWRRSSGAKRFVA